MLSGNEAVARVAYQLNDVCALYPITPSSEMSELVEKWSAEKVPNLFGNVPGTVQMQSDGGAAGLMHGALQMGTAATTFTASQGLLMMIPNMYKIAGQLIPNVIHVATRSLATHALSVFGDHSDIMAVRQTGYAFLGSATVQEAHDFALISHVSSLASRIPFVHFFDGFRTSHEWSCIDMISQETMRKMIPNSKVNAHIDFALNPNDPVIRGTAQTMDRFFQSREAVNVHYTACPGVVQETMDEFAKITGRSYKLFDYVGHPEAERIVIAMASSTSTIEEVVIEQVQKGEKIGLLKVRLFRPFSQKHLLAALPKSCKAIAVLDRTKEPGSSGEPLYLDIVCAVSQHRSQSDRPKIIGGRYGLSSKEFTPAMAFTVFEELKKKNPKNGFTIGIHDDVTHQSLATLKFKPAQQKTVNRLIYQFKTNDGAPRLKEALRLERGKFIQCYMECDYKKIRSRAVWNIRTSDQPIEKPYLIEQSEIVLCVDDYFLFHDNVIDRTQNNGCIILYSNKSDDAIWNNLSDRQKSKLITKKISIKKLTQPICLSSFFNGSFSATIVHFKADQIPTFTNATLDCSAVEPLVSEMPVDGTFRLHKETSDQSLYNFQGDKKHHAPADYLELVTKLFGDRMIIANATGSSSIVGGSIDSSPWRKNKEGRGPAWANSLFEDNGEFGLGMKTAINLRMKQAKRLLIKLKSTIDSQLVDEILDANQINDVAIKAQRKRVKELVAILETMDDKMANDLKRLSHYLVDQSLWIIGGDGWAYDIGFGGLDHVLASGENVNILVLDNEMYENTGGQISKATPYGAKVRCASKGKMKNKKNLGKMAMNYDDVYVAQVAIGADPAQCKKAFLEAERFDGPSLIIAYCHSHMHRKDKKNTVTQKNVVDVGHWTLYRNNPDRLLQGLPALQIDSLDPNHSKTQMAC